MNIAGGAVEAARAEAKAAAEKAGLDEEAVAAAMAAVTPKKTTEKLFKRSA